MYLKALNLLGVRKSGNACVIIVLVMKKKGLAYTSKLAISFNQILAECSEPYVFKILWFVYIAICKWC